MESVISSLALRPHHGTTFNPICMLGSCHIGPIIERSRSQDSPIDYCLSEGRIQPPSEQEDRSSGVSFPLRNVSKVIKGCDVSIEIFPLHLDGQ